jgi:hypothetical protein
MSRLRPFISLGEILSISKQKPITFNIPNWVEKELSDDAIKTDAAVAESKT